MSGTWGAESQSECHKNEHSTFLSGTDQFWMMSEDWQKQRHWKLDASSYGQ